MVTSFDRETLLDLVVNGVPLFILLFFTVSFLVVNPFGFDPLLTGVQHALIVMPFVSLVLLSYLSAKAISRGEQSGEVYPPGQTTVPGVDPVGREERDELPETTPEESTDSGDSS